MFLEIVVIKSCDMRVPQCFTRISTKKFIWFKVAEFGCPRLQYFLQLRRVLAAVESLTVISAPHAIQGSALLIVCHLEVVWLNKVSILAPFLVVEKL